MNEILSIIVPIGAGILGYILREWQNRVKPFVEILKIEGSISKRDDTFEITDTNIINLTTDSIYIDSLVKDSTVGEISDVRNSCILFRKIKTDLDSNINEIISLPETDKTNILKIFGKLCNDSNFDHYLTVMIAGDRISPFSFQKTKYKKELNVHFDKDESKGTIWISFPNNTTNLGQMLNNKALYTKFSNMIEILEYCVVPGIKHYLKEFKKILDNEVIIANQLYPVVDSYINENSRWAFRFSVTNINNKPILITKSGVFTIHSRGYKKIREICYLVSINKEGNFQDTLEPIVIRSGETKQIGYISKNRQKDMKKGKTVRSLFESNNAYIRFDLDIKKVGLLGKQKFSTTKLIFTESSSNA